MIDILTVRILEGIQGIPYDYVGEARWINDNGDDKCFTISGKDIDYLAERMGEKLTEVLCK